MSGGRGGPCPAGHYCPLASVSPLPCPRATYSNLTKLVSQEHCRPCAPGYYCDAVGLSAPSGRCAEGFFCLEGADRPDPPFRGSSGGPCPKGHYCPGGSAAPRRCPLGTISREEGQTSCRACPQGSYCPGSYNGSLSTSFECPVGHYCPSGTWSEHLYPCPAGSINPHTGMGEAQDCSPCPPGFFCASSGRAVASDLCTAGYYCLSGARSPTPEDGGTTGDRCPEGHYCPRGSSTPLPCPAGHYSNETRNSRLSDCLSCPAGLLCVTRGLSFPSQMCPAGSYCPGGGSGGRQASILCSPGNKCPPGSERQVPCSPGTYQDLPGQAQCAECPAGYYCAGSVGTDSVGVSGAHSPMLCPRGHYCPPGAQSGAAFPCPAGAFGGQMGLSDRSACERCPPGRYCGSSGLAAPSGLCSPGYICILGSASAQPVEGPTGGRCSAGFYCPEGTINMVPCPAGTFGSIDGAVSVEACRPCLPGYYCAEVGLSSPSGPCTPGFYCTDGSRTASPRGNITAGTSSPEDQFHGGACPAGHYCPLGSAKPSPCPPGTFSGRSSAESEAGCEACYPGSYCPSWAQTSVDLPCPPGWFCPAGSASGHQTGCQCPPGHVCPRGSAEPAICSSGTFQSLPGQSACDSCPPGFYCAEGSPAPTVCPAGSVNPSSGGTSLSDCSACPSGSFCDNSGHPEPTGPCSAGYFCSSGSSEPSPVSKTYGDVCPVGHFCPRGSGSPTPCPVGSFLPEPGASSSSQCHGCPPGKYCATPGSSQPTGPCSGGFFCSGGADSPTPRASSSLFTCLWEILEVYGAETADASWTRNLSRFDSPRNPGRDTTRIDVAAPQANSDHGVTLPPPRLSSGHNVCSPYKGDMCPKGFYCLRGSAYPQLCEAGSYCDRTGLEVPAGHCAAGYYCPTGSSEVHAVPCTSGHYCPLGTPLPLPCPPGTMKSWLGGSALEACRLCPPGYYCEQAGMAEPSGSCAEGYYCPGGQSSQRPDGHICSAGHHCEKGSVRQAACPPGSFQLREGQGSCETCPAGSYCQDQGMTVPLRCERGFYCPRGSANQHPCPPGTYGNVSGLAEERQCTQCDPGMYCKETGRAIPTGPCAAGYVCIGGASEPSPVDSPTGFLCPSGFFCSVGTSVPEPCPKGTFSEKMGLMEEFQCRRCAPGFYCSDTGLSAVSGPCLAGFYCLEGSVTAAPMQTAFGDVCPAGHYCVRGSSVPTPCPAGFHRNKTGGKGEADCYRCPNGWFQESLGQTECLPCPPGFHCQSQSPSPLLCPAGYICPDKSSDSHPLPCPQGTYNPGQGLATAGECLACPAGRFCASEGLTGPSGFCAAGFLCVTGASVPNPTDNRTGSLCPPGTFCQRGSKAGDCLAGFYCNWGSSRADETLCPAGFFCLRATPVPLPCPAGTFSTKAGNTHQDNCTSCTPGYYCKAEGTVQPALCPAGHYCPPGRTLGWELPCPTGTVQSQPGASSAAACLPCPPGMFCSYPGLSQPTGLCQAGFYCAAGSTSPNATSHQGNSTRSHLCPPGHYCPVGTGQPLPCPAGSLSTSQGRKGDEECSPCPPGAFCDRPALAELSDALPCHAGYVCLGGSSTPAPSDGSHGYLCPAGHSCPVGSAREVPCEPGTYSPAPGAARCLSCPRGTVCSSSGTKQPSLCPAGHLCPAGTALPQPCPSGTFSNNTGAHNLSVCAPCPSGSYCHSAGTTIPEGTCLQGFFCRGGATDPAPQTSDDSPNNGPCPLGHYCPAGCLSPIPCPPGSIRNSTGGVTMESCSTCPAGHYCSTEGLAKPSGPCAPGFYCPFDFSSTTPYAFLCPKGHYCPEGSPLALPCPTGEYQPNPGSPSCIPCRPGFYCEEAIVGEPRPCPPHSFCPAGTMVPEPCPNGTYTYPNQGGLRDERECLPCPPGNFCRAGRILGVCAAGSLCLSGSADSTPQGRLSNLTQCQWGMQCAGPCPAGFFCPAGAVEAEICPANTFRSSPGGASRRDCLPCPPQYWCKAGDPLPQLCPPGHYCDGMPGGDFSGAAGPRPCPLHTYRAAAGAGSKADCLACPPGSHCDSTGLSDYSSRPCPPGFWCSGSGPPVLCPAGTYRALPGANAPGQCEPCPGGSFCPDPQVTGKANVEGIPCRASYQCPVGSVSEMPCRAGSYCGPRTAEPQVCPEGYICPEGSYSYQATKQLCLFPYYCPANSSAMKSCDGGFMPVNTSGLRGSKSSCCSACEGGTYRPHLSLVLHCLPCPAGYFCSPGTGYYKGNSCPAGYTCPIRSSQPTPCRPGTFGNRSRAEDPSDCHPCPAGTFNHRRAQTACFPCGSSSTSQAGSPSCTCSGKNRAFQHSDGSCLCRTGFIFYDKLDFKRSTADSGLDCQPEANQRCSTGQVRLAASRECVSPPLYSCNVTCAPYGGSLDAEMGICHCERYVSSEELCNTSCLSRLPQLLSRSSPDGLLQLSLMKRDKIIWHKAVTNILGPDHIAESESKAYLVEFDSEGVFGWIPTHGELVAQFLSEPAELVSAGLKARRGSVDESQKTNPSVSPRIPNPIVCLSAGDMLIFALTVNHTDRRLSHFPVYQKDHLFNSNPSWDFGAFRRLQTLIKQSNVNSTRFAHVFADTGKYVFVDSAVPDWSMVVAVSEEGTECDPRSPVFQPMTPAQLVKHGIVKQHRLNLLPDWGLIAGLLSLLLVAVLVVTTTVIVLRPGKAKLVSQWRLKPKWRNLGEPFCPVDCACTGDGRIVSSLGGFPSTRVAGEGAESEEPAVSKGGSVSRYSDLEEFNVKTLFDKLEDQNLHVASQLARHRKDTQEFYRSICQQAESLKEVFENMDSAKLSLLKELLVQNSVRGTPPYSRAEETDAQAEAFIELLGAVLRSVEALLCRQKSQDLHATLPPNTRDCDQPAGSSPAADANMCFTRFSSGNITKAEEVPGGLDPSLSDHDLPKLVTVSPLFKTLQEIKQSLQDLDVAESYQQPHQDGWADSIQEGSGGVLVPTPLDSLSSQHSAVFLLGCQVMRLLADCPRFPSAVLLPARSIPVSSKPSDEAQLAPCPRDFYFDGANQILYLPETELQHVGSFIATIVLSMAHVASGSKPQGYAHALHEAVSVVGLQLFKLSFRWSKEEAGGSEGRLGTLAEEFLSGRVPTEAQFTDQLLASRLEGYSFFKLEQLVDDVKRNSPEDSFVFGKVP
ncbi:uncharacterized protein LOC142895201 [Nelusetta ayraudi]|uniref:uncharacterized protein LOC142895201 n=1 Tax=Nelusetta ayraudi TaxID=303726 RepID=UPI003F724926